MMQSLWTAASGMTSQQRNLDVISNNISNINTTGYKRETPQFKTLLYQTVQDTSTDSQGAPKPLGVQVGLGVRNSSIRTEYSQGILDETGNKFDLALEGKGFFMIGLPNGEIAYTRSGAFGVSMGYNGSSLVDSEGNPVLDINGEPIIFDINMDITNLSINDTGNIIHDDGQGNYQQMFQIGLAQFNNPAGLSKISNSLLIETESSGAPRIEAYDGNIENTKVVSGYLEGSNVDVAGEMVDLIVAQRAYEMNSKAIQASDEMLQIANNLRR